MDLTMYHNPRCSKSRATLALLNERGIEPTLVRYLENPPTGETIRALAAAAGIPVAALLRTGEAVFRDADPAPPMDDDAALANWLAERPEALQRPVVFDALSGRAVVGRPPENVLDLLDE